MDAVNCYMNDLGRFDLCDDQAEEYRLIEQAQAGDENARNELVEKNLRLVVSVATSYYRHLPLEEKIAEGNLGLFEAIERFDLTSGLKFSTYATPRILLQILRVYRRHGPAKPKSRQPIYTHTLQNGFQLRTDGRRMPPLGPVEESIAAEIVSDVTQCIKRLPPSRRFIADRWFRGETHKAIAGVVGVSRQRISQVVQGVRPAINDALARHEVQL